MINRCPIVALFFALVGAAPASASVCYVKANASGSNNGTSWANAYTNLQSALANYPACTDVYIARGTYKPTATNDRTISFGIQPGVFVYGGFAGTEAALGDRNLTINQTILSGDIGVAGDSSDNSYHVIVFDGTTAGGTILGSTALFDATIRDGNANGSAFGAYQDSGGGVLCRGNGAGHESSPTLSNLIFEDNRALQGGAIYNLGSSSGKASPEITNVILRDNSATYLGGAIYNNGTVSGTSSPLIQGTSFSNNTAQNGGAIVNAGAGGTSSPTIRNSTFYANIAQIGGAIVNTGQNGGHASPVLRYVTFNGNRATAGAGGAIFNLGNPSGDAAPNISGAIFWGDTATTPPNEMATQSPTTPSIEYSITPECPGGAVGCINADPLLDPLRDNGGFAPSMRPQVGSPAIEAGNATNCPAFDQRGILRPQGAQCDIGAVELLVSETHRCYVNSAPHAGNNGLSWATAYLGLGAGLADTNCSEVWVAKGTYAAANILLGSAFFLPPGKAVYGGFVGTEIARSQRDPILNENILDGQTFVYHVVAIDATGNATNVTDSTILDGFTITRGNANGIDLQGFGGGLFCNGNSGYTCNPTLANLVFKDNSAKNGGALMNNGSAGGMSSPRLQSVTFSTNHATTNGGAVYNAGDGGISSPAMTGVAFTSNSAENAGGAIYSSARAQGVSAPIVVASTFSNNQARYGGAIVNEPADGSYTDVVFSHNQASEGGGAVYSTDFYGPGSATFTSVQFIDNSAGNTGGAVTNDGAGVNAMHFSAVSFIGNFAQGSGGAIQNTGGSVTLRNTLFIDNGTAGFGGAMSNNPNRVWPVTPVIDGAAFIGNHTTVGAGGALYVQGGQADATLLVSNATFRNNSAHRGGAIGAQAAYAHSASMTLRNVTINANTASSAGGGVWFQGDVNNGVPASATMSNSILWGDSAPSAAEIFRDDTTVVTDHTLIQGGCPPLVTCNTLLTADPLLGALQYNGGSTPTLMPAANSPALDTGANCTASDQRGIARPQGPACDIGAVERRATEDYLFNNGFEF